MNTINVKRKKSISRKILAYDMKACYENILNSCRFVYFSKFSKKIQNPPKFLKIHKDFKSTDLCETKKNRLPDYLLDSFVNNLFMTF